MTLARLFPGRFASASLSCASLAASFAAWSGSRRCRRSLRHHPHIRSLAHPPIDMHPLKLRGLQMLQVLFQGPFVKLGQKRGRGGRIELPNPFDQLTFGHGRFTFGYEDAWSVLLKVRLSHRKSQCLNLNLRAKPPILPPNRRTRLPICTKCPPRPAWEP